MKVAGRDHPLVDLMLPWRTQPQAGYELEWLLSWRARLTDLIGRQEERLDLLEWAEHESKISVRLIHGEAGSGKTRLSAEIAESLREKHWAAGFIDLERPTAFQTGDKGTLLLVDYPEERRSAVRKLLVLLGRLEEPDKPLRLLLISRQSTAQWQPEISAAHASVSIAAPLELGALVETSPWALFCAAWGRACEVLGHSATEPPFSEDKFIRWIADDALHQRPLFTLAYAVQLAYEPENQERLAGREILRRLSNRELARWRNESEGAGMNSNALLRLKGLTYIPNGLSPGQVRALAERTELALNLPSAREAVDRVRLTGEFVDNSLPAVEPDLLAANVVHEVLQDADDQAGAWLWAAFELVDSTELALHRIARLASDVAFLELSWPGELLALEVDGRVDRCRFLDEALDEIVEASGSTYDRTVWLTPEVLAPLWVAVWRTLAEVTEDKGDQACHLDNLSTRLAQLGEHEEAIATARQAVEIYKGLADQHPARFKPQLGSSLNNLSNRFGMLGKYIEAVEAGRQTVKIFTDLALDDPKAYESELAGSLGTLSNWLSTLNKSDEALSAMRESVEIYERLAQQDRTYERFLAVSLHNLGTQVVDRDEALRATQRAVEIRRRLANQDHVAYDPDLAESLWNLSYQCLDVRDRSGAVVAIKEAVDIYGAVSATEPRPPCARCDRRLR
jgi:tetratricopeptide (TPR) repeat protein